MDKSLKAFLNPPKKANIRFKLGRFTEPFELRILSAKEDMEINKEVKQGEDFTYTMARYIANSLVTPDLHNQELLEALSEREGRKIFDVTEALLCLVNGNELATLIGVYNDFADCTLDFEKEVQETKN